MVIGLATMLAAVPLAAQGGAATPPAVTAFVDVAVLPMDRERVLSGQTVVVEGDRIIAMGPTGYVSIPAAAAQVDGRGKFLIPGLGDMHAHVPDQHRIIQWVVGGDPPLGDDDGLATAERMLFLYLANGVTTVRLMYGWPETLTLRARAAKGELLSPRIYAATAPLYDEQRGAPPVMPVSFASPEEAVSFVEAAKKDGYDLIKLYGLTGELLDTVAAAAHRAGLPIAGHAPLSDHSLEDAIRVGYRSIEHFHGFAQYFAADLEDDDLVTNTWPAQLAPDTAKLRTLATSIRQAGLWNCPTQLLLERGAMSTDSVLRWPEWRYLTAGSRQEEAAKQRQFVQMTTPAAVASRRAIVKALHDAGAGLLLGTDASVSGVPGFAVHRELELLVRAGLTPYEALATGTRSVADYFGTLDSTGTIAVGKRADLVLLSGNPLNDIRNTATPAGVMLGGRWLSRAILDTRLAALEGTAY